MKITEKGLHVVNAAMEPRHLGVRRYRKIICEIHETNLKNKDF